MIYKLKKYQNWQGGNVEISVFQKTNISNIENIYCTIS